jgi:hypothetical protein
MHDSPRALPAAPYDKIDLIYRQLAERPIDFQGLGNVGHGTSPCSGTVRRFSRAVTATS